MQNTKRAVLTAVNPETGEVLKGDWHYRERQRELFKEPYMVAFHNGMQQLARSDLTANDHKVLLALLTRLNSQNAVLIAQKEIADATGIHPNNISRSVNRLLERQIISKGPKFGHSNSFKLNPDYYWFGTAKERRIERQKQSNAGLKTLLRVVKATAAQTP